MSTADELYIVTDIEADGPVPGMHSMLSLASAAYTSTGNLVGQFSENLLPIEGATAHPATEAWWRTQPEALEAVQQDQQSADVVMPRYRAWVEGLTDIPTFVAYPVAFDYTFVTWYLNRFAGDNPFQNRALDMRTLAMTVLGKPFSDCAKEQWPSRWFDESLPHSHVAIDDALGHGASFFAMLAELQSRKVSA